MQYKAVFPEVFQTIPALFIHWFHISCFQEYLRVRVFHVLFLGKNSYLKVEASEVIFTTIKLSKTSMGKYEEDIKHS